MAFRASSENSQNQGLVSLYIIMKKASSVFAPGIKAYHAAHLLQVDLLGMKDSVEWMKGGTRVK